MLEYSAVNGLNNTYLNGVGKLTGITRVVDTRVCVHVCAYQNIRMHMCFSSSHRGNSVCRHV